MSFQCGLCLRRVDLRELADLSCSCLVCVACSRSAIEQQLRRAGTPTPVKPPDVQVQIEPGDVVLYRTADGTYVEAVVEMVDISVQPPQYGIQLAGADNLRFTEQHRLCVTKSGNKPSTQQQQQKPQPQPQRANVVCARCSTPLAPHLMRALAPEAVAAWEADRTASWLKVHDVIACPHPGCGAFIQRVQSSPSTAGTSDPSRRHPRDAHPDEDIHPRTRHWMQQQRQQQQRQQQQSPQGSAAAAAATKAAAAAAAAAHRERHRYRCGACGRDFCDACMAAPYHNGFTCSQARAPDCLLCGGKVDEDRLQQLLPAASAKAKAAADGGDDGPVNVETEERRAAGGGAAAAAAAAAAAMAAVVRRATRGELLAALRSQLEVDTAWCLERRDLERALLYWGCRTCSSSECATKRRGICSRPLACGHWCFGIRGEGEAAGQSHPRCVECGAEGAAGKRAVTPPPAGAAAGAEVGECCFCWEALTTGPCIEMACGPRHLCHLDCALARLRAGYPGPHISFTHLYCPLCRNGAGSGGPGPSGSGGSGGVQSALAPVHLSHPALSAALQPHLDLRDAVLAAARARMRLEPALKADPELRPGGRYDGRLADYGLDRFLFYKCSKCSKPYYGGQRACGAAAADAAQPQQQQPQAGPGAAGGDAEQQLVCGECCARACGTNCPRHGTTYIEWKCKYCCSLASWFCFGTTHMCEPCHSAVARGKAQQNAASGSTCTDPKCGLKGIPHPPPGKEACLGCGMCRAGL